MKDWNSDKAMAFVNAIEDPISKRLTRLFLDAAIFYSAKKATSPEADFDLFFFVTVVSQVTITDLKSLKLVLAGENIDAGWEAVVDELDRIFDGKPGE